VPSQAVVRKVHFEVRLWGDGPDKARELLPYIDGVSFGELVSGFEHVAGYDLAGRYVGIVLDHFNFGDLASYLGGQPDSSYWAAHGAIALLGCNCGEVECWPFEGQVLTVGDLVIWRGFTQPQRPKRDYGSFGPFVFRRTQYVHAVREAVRDARTDRAF
jgi:hypothetical protein